ncbi:MAG: aminoacyl-tRNA hydrolase [Pseudomonadales bacterium]
MSTGLRLIVGIGNPGSKYADTRHNAGVWFVDRLADRLKASFKEEKKFFGRTADVIIEQQPLKLLIPATYMNESGKSVGALANFYKIPVDQILIAHDELDFAIGMIRLKQGGGLAGHNGLRDIVAALGGDQSFNRLRIGVGHPGSREDVTGHVLSKATPADRDLIYTCIDEALQVMPLVVKGEWQQAMNQLHNFKVED